MLALVEALIGAFVAAFRPRASFVAENLALRQQLAVLMRDQQCLVATHHRYEGLAA